MQAAPQAGCDPGAGADTSGDVGAGADTSGDVGAGADTTGGVGAGADTRLDARIRREDRREGMASRGKPEPDGDADTAKRGRKDERAPNTWSDLVTALLRARRRALFRPEVQPMMTVSKEKIGREKC